MNSANVNVAYQERLDFALQVARESQDLILRYYQNADLAVELKGDTSPVTAADRGAELLIRERLAVRFPHDGILGEEFGEQVGTTGFRWILDPVDGTKSFVHGVPLFGTLIGIEHEKTCVAGVCRFPALDEVVYAVKGGGAWWQKGSATPQRAKASSVVSLSEATFCNTNPARWYKLGLRENYDELIKSVHLARGWGDCFGHVLVATGRAELMVDPSLNPWDAAALLPILEESGACFVDFKGNPTIYGGSGISVVAGLKEQILELVNRKFS